MRRLRERLGASGLAILLLVLAIGAATRVALLERHFTHVDDIGVAVHLVHTMEHRAESLAHARRVAQSFLKGERGTAFEQSVVRRLDGLGLTEGAVRVWHVWSDWHATSRAWTYAPGQFYLTRLLVAPGQDYATAKVMGRLPSLLFGLLAMALVPFVLAFQGDAATIRERALFGAAIVALSWQCVAYSVQMESYSVVVFSVTCLFLLLSWVAARQEVGSREAVVVGLVLGALATTQYQVLFFLPAFYAAAGYALSGRIPRLHLFRAGALSGLVFLLLTMPTVFPFLLSRTGAGVHWWNRGPHGEYVFEPALWGDGPAGLVSGGIGFFLRNIPEVTVAMLSPVSEGSAFLPLLGIVLVGLAIIGFLALLDAPAREGRATAIFVATILLTWVLLLVARMITMGPTRHSMALIPVLAVLAAEGLGFVVRRLRSSGMGWSPGGIHCLAMIVVAGWAALFLSSASGEIARRTDPLTEATFLARLERDGVEVVVHYGWSYGPLLMPSVKRRYPILDGDATTWPALNGAASPIPCAGAPGGRGPGRSGLVVAFYSHRVPFAQEAHLPLLQALGRRCGLEGDVATETLRRERIDSTTEVEWSTRTRNGANAMHYTVIRLHGRG